jgi:DNA-binding CsgD family transcriptional regulator
LACAHIAQGFAFAARGRYTDAFEALLPVFDPLGPSRTETERFHAVGVFVEAAVHAERRDDAGRVVAELEAVAALTPAPALHVELGYARAVLAGPDRQEAAFRSALAMDLARWPWPEARLQLAFGSWLRRHRRAAESRVLLRAAAATFASIGAEAWGELARNELRAAGEAPRNASPDAGAALTSQELQIARLAAGGMSNREIGEKLYLSPRTVGSHLYRIFPKAGITSRSQLAEWLSREATGR